MYWFSDDKFWWHYSKLEKDPNPRHWNVFGLTEPTGGTASHDIACEINIPLSNGTWRVAGAFVEDGRGGAYVVHSGKIGGGRSGIGRDAFKKHAYSRWAHAERNGKLKDVVMVSALDDASLIRNLAYFAKEVDRVKKLTHSGKTPPPPPDKYRREFSGPKKSYSVKEEIRARVEHGRIVHSVSELAKDMGLDFWNNQNTDLLVRRKHTALVEVKTDDSSYSRYTAIGQLLYYSKSDDDILVSVFPSIDAPFKKVLERRGIVGVTWSRSGSMYKFGPELRWTLKRL